MTDVDTTAPARAAGIRRFLSFCVVGGLGFLTDLGVLIAVMALGAGALSGRAASFSVAVLVTWLLNRTMTFRTTAPPTLRELVSYLSVQIVGLLVNLAIYTALIAYGSGPFATPAMALTVASAIALAVNYAGANSVVFRKR